MSKMVTKAETGGGFTLLEIIVVVALISMIAMMAMPFVRSPSPSLTLRSEATRLVSALRATRAASMASNQPHTLAIDVDRRVFRSPVVRPTAIDKRIILSMTVADQTRASAGEAGVQFFPSGRSSGGQIRMQLSTAMVQVRINWATGASTIDE